MKTLLKAAGARLERICEMSKAQKAKALFRVWTLRPPRPRFIADRYVAEEPFTREVTAR